MNGKMNNKGVTLVELILAMAMSAIVMSAVIYFIFAGSNSFRYSHTEALIQSEAQIVMNQITERTLAYSDVEVDEEDAGLFRVFNRNADGDPVPGDSFWLGEEGKFYVFENQYVRDVSDYDEGTFEKMKERAFLGDYVTGMEAKRKEFGDNVALEVTLKVEKDGRVYETSNLIRLRN